jgi:hypothetical protein
VKCLLAGDVVDLVVGAVVGLMAAAAAVVEDTEGTKENLILAMAVVDRDAVAAAVVHHLAEKVAAPVPVAQDP